MCLLSLFLCVCLLVIPCKSNIIFHLITFDLHLYNVKFLLFDLHPYLAHVLRETFQTLTQTQTQSSPNHTTFIMAVRFMLKFH